MKSTAVLAFLLLVFCYGSAIQAMPITTVPAVTFDWATVGDPGMLASYREQVPVAGARMPLWGALTIPTALASTK